jgi:hypothetical protein
MKQSTKLMLDILMGAVIPILILNYLTRPLGAPVAYVVAALVPVGWVAFDLFFLTKKFNFITSFIGLTAIVNGALAFWFVDGVRFAIKDTAALALNVLVFAGSILIGRPVLRFFAAQALNPDTAEREAALGELLDLPDVRRALVSGTLVIVLANLLMAAVNFYLNLTIVTAPFGGEEFNTQVARVNGITRILLPIPSIAAFAAGIYLVYRALYRELPTEAGKPQLESDFWDLVALRENERRPEALSPEV